MIESLKKTTIPNLCFKDVLTEMWFGGDAGLSSWEGFVILILELGTSIPNNICLQYTMYFSPHPQSFVGSMR